MVDVSIIVPIYNAGKKLNKCISSILKQTYKNFELILVNDGSTDGSYEICKKYQLKDDRIIIINQENQGSVKARSNGIDKAIGKYITFVDADDWIPNNSLELLFNNIKENDCDIVVGNMVRVLGTKNIIKKENKSYFFDEEKIYKDEEIKDTLIEAWLYGHPFPAGLVAKLYKIELFDNTGNLNKYIKFSGDDLFLNMEIFLKAKSVSILSENVYFYSTGGGTSKYMPNYFDDIVTGYKIQKDIIDKYFLNKKQYEYNGISIMLLNSFKTSLYNLFLSDLSQNQIIHIINNYIKDENILEACENEGSINYFDEKYLSSIKQGESSYLYDLGLKMYNETKIKRKVKNVLSKIL